MADSFFFYDLETSGINPRDARVMQFAGQRTDMDLNPIGDPVNVLIKMTADTVPEPDAIMITGITPQQTLADGISEVEFLQLFYKEVVQPGTIFIGFNSVRFDDEFMRFLHFRNFYDAYEWQWCNDCSRWDLLDVIRMTRALRPDGIEWPFTPEGKPTNRLELLTKMNGLDHEHAHDALNDVLATIAVAKLVHDKQKGLFEYLLECRNKNKVKEIVEAGRPFVYTSGRYPSEFWHTSAAIMLTKHAEQGCAYVYDLRFDPTPFLGMSVEQLAEAYRFSRDPKHVKLPVKPLRYNRCPAIAPMGVIKDSQVQERIQLPLTTVETNRAKLKVDPGFGDRVLEAIQKVETEWPDKSGAFGDEYAVDGQLYDGFIPKSDTDNMRRVRSASPDDCAKLDVEFQDKRLQAMFPLFKARNYAKCIFDDDRKAWDAFCKHRLLEGGQNSRLAKFFARLEALAKDDQLTADQRYSLEELQLYGQSIMPVMDDEQ